MLLEDKYPLPRIEDIFAKMAGGKRFSKINPKNAYLQIEVTEDSKQYLTINPHKGLFEYNRLPFGIKTAPSIWQRADMAEGNGADFTRNPWRGGDAR